MGIIIEILITMAFSAFFSGMEIAFVSSNKLRFEMDRNSQSLTSRILSIFFHDPNNFISTMLVGNNIALVIYGILMAQVIEQNILAGLIENEFLLVLIQTIISTLIILVTGEFLPKTLFKINPNLTLNILAVPAFICYIVLYPISKFASSSSNLILRIFGIKVNKEASDKAFTKVDLDYFIQSSIQDTDNGKEIDTEIKIFQNALDFSNIKIRDCMVPRTEIVSIEYGTSLEELKARFIESGIIHGAKTLVIQNEDGQIEEPYSISAGLDYPGIGPMHANLARQKRAIVLSINDDEAIRAAFELTRLEGIIPALESAHALGALNKMQFRPEDIVVLTVSGRGDKDTETYLNNKPEETKL